MKRLLLIAAILFAGTPPLWGQLKIEVQSFPPGQPLKPGTAALLTLSGVEPGQAAVWHHGQSEGDIVIEFGDGKHALFAGTTAGPRTFVVQVPADGQDPFSVLQFNYGTGGNDDPPDPPIPPVTDPVKIVVILEETENRTVEQNRVINSPKLILFTEKQKLSFRVLDTEIKTADGQPHPTIQRLQSLVEKARTKKKPLPLPVLLILAQDQTAIKIVGLPSEDSSVIEIVSKYLEED